MNGKLDKLSNMAKSYQEEATSALKWTAIAEIAAKLIVPITNMILARLLAPEVFGIVASVTVITTFADIVSESGFGRYILQKKFSNDQEKKNSVGTATVLSLAFSFLMMIFIVVFRDPFSSLVNAEGHGTLLAVSSLSIPLYGVTSIQSSVYRRDFKFKSLTVIRVAMCVSSLAVSVVTAALGLGAWSLILGSIVSLFLQFILLCALDKDSFSIRFRLKSVKEMWFSSGMFLISAIVVWADSSINTLFAGKFLGQAYSGMVLNAFSTSGGIIRLFSSIYTPVLISLLAKFDSKGSEFARLFSKYQKAVCTILAPLGIGMLVFRDFITLVFFGEGWEAASLVLGLYGLIGCYRTATDSMVIAGWNAQGKPWWIVLCDVFSTISLSIAWVVTKGQPYEIVVISVCLAYLPANFVCLLLSRKTMNISGARVFLNYVNSLLPAVLMGLGGFFSLRLDASFIMCFVYIFGCCVFYITYFVFYDFESLKELISVTASSKKIKRYLSFSNPDRLFSRES